MPALLSFFSNKKYILLVIALLSIFYMVAIINPILRMDDDLLAEQAWFLAKNGYVKSNLLYGINGLHMEDIATVYHKLFIYQGAAAINIFGFSILPLHLISITYLGLLLLLVYRYIHTNFQNNSLVLYAVFVVLFCFNMRVLYGSVSYRPEVMLAFFGFANYTVLQKYLQTNKAKWLILTGITCTACLLTHLNGLIFSLATATILLMNKKWTSLFFVGAIAIAFFVPFYFWDVVKYKNLSFFIFQLTNDPALQKDSFGIGIIVKRILGEFSRLFYTEREIVFSSLFIICCIACWKLLMQKNKTLVVYTFALMGWLALYTYSTSPHYTIPILPFQCLIISICMVSHHSSIHKTLKYTMQFLLLAYLLIMGFYNIKMLGEGIVQLSNPSESTFNKQVSQAIGITANKKVLAYPGFIFNEMNAYNRIESLTKYEFYYERHTGKKMDYTQLLDTAYKTGMQYIVIDKNEKAYFDIGDKVIDSLAKNNKIIFSSTLGIWAIQTGK